MNKIFGNLEPAEFEQLMNKFIEREDPDAISLSALDEAARHQFAQAAIMRVELTGKIRNGRIIFDPSPDAPIMTKENELIIGGLHLVVKLREEEVA